MERLISNQSNSGVLKCDSNIKSIITVDIHINFATNHQLTKKNLTEAKNLPKYSIVNVIIRTISIQSLYNNM